MEKRKGKVVSKPFYANCYIALLYLKFTGKIVRIKKIKDNHYLGLRPNGAWVHFKAMDQGLSRLRYSLLFKGYLEILPKRKNIGI